MRSGEEKLRFDVISENGETYVDCFYAFVTPALSGHLHRQHGYRVRFNDNANYPQILEYLDEVALPKSSLTDAG